MKNYILLLTIFLSSCSYHYFGHVPIKPGKYPEFTSGDTLIAALDSLRACYDVKFYNMDLSIDPAKKEISGVVAIHFTAVNKSDKLRFDLYKNLSISSILFDGSPLTYTRNDRAVIVSLPLTMSPGNEYSILVGYNGTPVKAKNPPWVGGLVWEKDRNGNPWIGVTCETEGGSIWFPCKDHLSDEPDSVRLRMTVPAGLKVVSNGIMTDHVTDGVKEKFTWETHYPINVYNITFYAGDFAHFSDTMRTSEGILILDHFVLPYHLDTARVHFSQVSNVIRIFSEAFGPYPWMNEGFKLVESPFEGMEHQTAIAYGSGFKYSSLLGGDYIIIHETAHEWWGNAVSVSNFSDIWLQEGFATYAEIVFAEHVQGYSNSLEYIKYSIAPYINNKRPVVGPRDVGFWDHKDSDVYFKGAMLLHTMRNIIANDSLFFDIIRSFYESYALKEHPTTADFISLVEKKTGKEWDAFFNVYLFQRETPQLLWYNYCPGESPETLPGGIRNVPFIIARWSRVPEGFIMPVRFLCENVDMSVNLEVTTEPLLFYLPKDMNCINLICNPEMSYFEKRFSVAVLSEFEGL